MSTNTPVVNKWSKRFPFALIILAVGLILSYLLIAPAPAFTRSKLFSGNENNAVSNEAAQLQRGWDAYAARYTAMAKSFSASSLSNQRGMDAYAARYEAMAKAHTSMEAAKMQRAIDAYAARYNAMIQHFTIAGENSQRSRDADAARYNAMAEFFAAKEVARLQRSIDADAARYNAMAEFFSNK
jgi:hypothetical protein